MGFMSVVQWRDKQQQYAFRSCGLRQKSLQVDPQTTIACWCEAAQEQEQEQEKPALLLIHGFGGSSTWQWSKQLKPLRKHFRLFLPDLLFFGKSTTTSHHRSEIFQAQMIALAMEAMGVCKYSVVGVSYGGFVAFWLAHLFPHRIQKVVITSSAICITPSDIEELLGRAHIDGVSDLFLPLSPAALRTLIRLSFLNSFPFWPSFILQDVIQYLYVENRKEREELLDSFLVWRQREESLPTLSQKVLIIWGDHDGIFPLELAHRLKEHLKDTAELAIVKNTSHAVQLDNPHEFNRLVQSFLLCNHEFILAGGREAGV